MWLIKLALRNARRNVRRSLLTAATVVIGVAMFVLFLSFLGGVMDGLLVETTQYIGQIRVVDDDYLKRESLKPLYEYIPDADVVVKVAEATEGVTGAFAVIQSGVALSAGDELGDVFGIATGTTPEWRAKVGLNDKIVEGRAPQGPGEWLVGSKLVKKADAKLGDEIILFGQTQDGGLSPLKGTLVGIVHAGTPVVDRSVYLSLQEMQNMVDIGPGAIEVLLYTDDLFGAAKVADRMVGNPVLAGLTVQAWTNREPYNAMLPMISGIQAGLAGALIFLTALAIWNTMTMSVLERTGEIGVMRAMGMGKVAAVSLFVIEASAIALVGGVVGVALGAGPALWLEVNGLSFDESMVDAMGTSYAMTSTMYADFSAEIAIKGLILGVGMAIFGSFIPSLRAAAIQPVEAMRHGR